MIKSNKVYDSLNSLFGSTNIDFMNHGYFPPSSLIKKENEIFKNQKSLYLSLFENIKTQDKSILEIGCGRGGGINTLNKYFTFSSVSACDINKENIKYCKKNFLNNIDFKVSDALSLDYADKSFDIIINVESSHCYEDFSKFFLEVKRVLKPGGIFLYTDCGDTIQNFPQFFYLFKNIVRQDITKHVADACFDDIKNFNNLNIKEEIKNWLISLSVFKYNEYSLKNNQYIKYICFDDDNWIEKK